MFQVRTDLALETKEKFEEDNVELKGCLLYTSDAADD